MQPNGQYDHEADMARGELYNLIKNAVALFEMIQPGENLEGWVASKITKAADYVNTVHDYLIYEKQFNSQDPVGDEYMESLGRNLETSLLENKTRTKR